MADLTDLAREVVTLPEWRLIAGMRDTRGGRYIRQDEHTGEDVWAVGEDGGTPAIEYIWPNASAELVPDLSDPATVGCVLALLRELTQTPGLYVRCFEPHTPDMSGTVRRRWRCMDAQGRRAQHDDHATEVEALVALWREVTRG